MELVAGGGKLFYRSSFVLKEKKQHIAMCCMGITMAW